MTAAMPSRPMVEATGSSMIRRVATFAAAADECRTSHSQTRQPQHTTTIRPHLLSRLALLCAIAVALVSSSSSLLLSTSGSELKYPCLVCQSFVSTYLQSYLTDRALNRGLVRTEGGGWSDDITVTQTPTAEAFCTSEAFERLTHAHLYMDLQDESEIARLEAQLGPAEGTKKPAKPEKKAENKAAKQAAKKSTKPRFADAEMDSAHAAEEHAAAQADGSHIQLDESHSAEEDAAFDGVGAGGEEHDPSMSFLEVDETLDDYGDHSVFLEMDLDLDLGVKEQLDSELLAQVEAEVAAELLAASGAPPSQEQIAKQMALRQASSKLAVARKASRPPIPAKVPAASVEYYASKPRPVCLVYDEGRCKQFDVDSVGTTDSSVHTLPNPFSKAYIQHTPDLLAKVTAQNRALKRRQYLNILSEADKRRIKRTEKELLRKAALDTSSDVLGVPKPKSSKPPLAPKYRKYEWCLSLVTRLRTLPELPRILANGCTFRNMTAYRSFPPSTIPPQPTFGDAFKAMSVDPVDVARAQNIAGEYSWPCPLAATCNGLRLGGGETYCGAASMDTRLQPIENTFMSVGMRTGALPAAIVAESERFTAAEQRAIEMARDKGGKIRIKGLKVRPPGAPSHAPAVKPISMPAPSVPGGGPDRIQKAAAYLDKMTRAANAIKPNVAPARDE